MQIIAVENDKSLLGKLEALVSSEVPRVEFLGYERMDDVLSSLKTLEPDVAFLRIGREDGEIDGMILGKVLRAAFPRINLIFMAETDAYSAEALRLRASGYLRDPVTEEAVRTELKSLRFRPEENPCARLSVSKDKEIFLEQKRLRFRYNKTRDLAAYLIGRPGLVSTIPELEMALWGETNKKHRSYLQNILSDFSNALRAAGGENVMIRRRGRIGIAVAPDGGRSNGPPEIIESYGGKLKMSG